ncbi:hypothetical protein EHYA_06611 [Embleya hyalina]|uniref:Uncharacterized protein n=1 Tax=Embleya hyalina TaxID=516124 RepID=A0A401YWF2_9ACTN|nr:hypothetical protein EHYA_06611 [Embleya hyalina]
MAVTTRVRVRGFTPQSLRGANARSNSGRALAPRVPWTRPEPSGQTMEAARRRRKAASTVRSPVRETTVPGRRPHR